MMCTTLIRVLPHPQFKGDWLVECPELLPYSLWYKSRDSAINYAKLLGREHNGEVHVLSRDGSTNLHSRFNMTAPTGRRGLSFSPFCR